MTDGDASIAVPTRVRPKGGRVLSCTADAAVFNADRIRRQRADGETGVARGASVRNGIAHRTSPLWDGIKHIDDDLSGPRLTAQRRMPGLGNHTRQ